MNRRRPWAWPLVPVYRGVLAAQERLREAGVGKPRTLGWPVVSVGSVSAGGAGKTPVVIALARLLERKGWGIDVLSRGYGRAGRLVEAVDLSHDDAAHQFGDEPVLIARRTGLPVWVGASRYEAGRAAEQAALLESDLLQPAPSTGGDEPARGQAPAGVPRVHLLDDGFQHRSLARQVDLVLVTADDLRDALLPAGNLREPLAALRRANAFAVREEELDEVSEGVRRLVGDEVPVWTVRRSLVFPSPLGVFSAGLRPLAFCGLARPADFATMLLASGCGIVDTVIFPDHHRYREDDLGTLVRVARQLQATGLVTTEKDAVKLSGAMRARLEESVGPLAVVSLEAHFLYESPVARMLDGRLRGQAPAPQRVEARPR